VSNPLVAIRGAVAFLTRLPVGGGQAGWEAFRQRPYAIVVVGYLVGALAGAAFFLPLQPTTIVAVYLVALYGLTGFTHADGLADLGDALAVHGDSERRREVLKDSATGVGGVLVLGLTLIVLSLGARTFAGIDPMTAFRVVIAAEVGAKLGMVIVACYGRSAHEGLGSQLVDRLDSTYIPAALIAAVPAVALAPVGSMNALFGASIAGPLVGVLTLSWAHSRLGGVNGDVLGATNEIGRAVGLHLGVSLWILL